MPTLRQNVGADDGCEGCDSMCKQSRLQVRDKTCPRKVVPIC